MVKKVIKKRAKADRKGTTVPSAATTISTDVQHYFIGWQDEASKLKQLCELQTVISVFQAVLVCESKLKAKYVSQKLQAKTGIESIMPTPESLVDFESGSKRLLVTTPSAAVALEAFPRVPVLINYDMPALTSYFDRVGQTAGRKSVVINFIDQGSLGIVDELQQAYTIRLHEFPATPFQLVWGLVDEATRMHVLRNLTKTIMPHMRQPILLCDFVKSCVEQGGWYSLYSLEGLYHLMINENFACPTFYTDLYSMFTANSLRTDYARTFLHLLSRFLTSSVLSATVVASFIKRASRLALYAPTCTIPTLLTIVHNLIKKHPNTLVMVQRTTTIKDDPFDDSCSNPHETGAINSSCWELKLLQNHWYPGVTSLGLLFSTALGNNNRERDIPTVLNQTREKQFSTENTSSTAEIPTTFEDTYALFDPKIWEYKKCSNPWQSVWDVE